MLSNLKRASRNALYLAKSNNISIQKQVANPALFSNVSNYAVTQTQETSFATPIYPSFSIRNMSMLKNTLKTELETTNRNFSALSADMEQMLRAEFEV